MGRLIFNIVIIFILFASFATVNYAFGENDIILTPNDYVFKNHSLIIDIGEPNTGPITITIQVDSGDEVITVVEYDDSWGKYRTIVSVVQGNPTEDNIIQAQNGDSIEVQYDGIPPSDWPKVIFHDKQSSGPSEDRWTYSEVLPIGGCDDNDIDNDGICDDWEQGSTLRISDPSINGEYTFDCLPGGGCDTTQKDIFVEIDWIESHRPDPKAIQQVIDAFANARDSNIGLDGIRLHVQVDPNSTYGHMWKMNFPGYDLDGYRGYDQLKASSFGTPGERNDRDTEWDEIKKLKHQVFHYGLFAHRDVDEKLQTGIGEIVGNDFLITLGLYSGRIGSTDQQSGTLMHELGHNFGLNHGGGEFDEINNKPNLFSVMTYARQFSDLDSNRKLDFSNATLGHHHTSPPKDSSVSIWGLHEDEVQGHAKGIFTYPGHEDEFIIFSCPDGQVAPIAYLTGKTGGVDWDCDGDKTTRGQFALNINNLPIGPTTDGERLDGHNDWGALIYDFTSNAGNYADGRHSKVASGSSQSGIDGIPFGETLKSLEEKGLEPDESYNFTATGKPDLTFEDVTLNRISNLLSLYRQVEMFEEDDFETPFSLGSDFWMNGNSMIFETQSTPTSEIKNDSINQVAYSIGESSVPKAFADHVTANVSVPQGTSVPGCEETNECFLPFEVIVDVGGEVIWSNDDSAAHTVTSGSVEGGASGVFDSSLFMVGTSFTHTFEEEGEFPYFCLVHPWMTGKVFVGISETDEKKNSFKAAVGSAINLINHHEIQKTKTAIQIIDNALKNSLSHNYDKIQPITSNLIGTYDKALGFGAIYIDEPEIESIVEERKIATMIKDVEEFVDLIKTTEHKCGEPFVKTSIGCECPSGFVENEESDCIPDYSIIEVYGTNFMVGYEITSGNLLSTTPDVDVNALIIAIDATDDGQLTITLPRELIDAKIGDDDDDYFVLVDGEEVDFDETTTSSDRTLVISFPTGAEEIEIIGTHVVPEFGAIAALILSIGIISIVILTTKSRVFPRL